MDAVSFNGVIIFSSVKVAVKVTSLSFFQQIIALILKTDFLIIFFFLSSLPKLGCIRLQLYYLKMFRM